MSHSPAIILIVDDELQNLKLLDALLQAGGYRTVCATSGEEAMILTRQYMPDLILLDVMMPGMDGYQVAALLKSDAVTSNIPVIMVTALGDLDARLAGLTGGAEEFLTKPVDRTELWLRVRNLLRLKEYGDLLQDQSLILEEQVAERTAELQRFRSAMDATVDAIFLTQRSCMQIVEVNATACAMLGYTRDEMLALGPASLGMADTEQLGRIYDTLIAGDSKRELTEAQVRHKDGAFFQIDLYLEAQRDGADWIIVSVMRDITERKFTEQVLLESEEYFRFMNDLTEATRMLGDPVQVMTVMARKLGERLRASRCAYADVMEDGERFSILHDYTDGCASTVGSYQLSLFGPKAVHRLSRGQTLIIRDVDTELAPEDGADMFNAIGIKAIISCPLVKQGRLRAMMAVHQTTTRDWTPVEVALVQEVVERCWATIERGTAEKKLRESEALLHIAGRTTQLGGWAVDLLDAQVTWSDQVCVILEVAPGSKPKREHLFQFCVPESRNRAADAFDICALQGVPFDLELEMITANGRRIWTRCTGEARHDDAGRTTHVHGALQDITERKESEAARERLAEILESTTDLVSISDPAGYILYLNRAGRQALDLGLQEDLTQTMITDFLPPLPQLAGTAGRIPTAIRDGVWSGEATLRGRLGREIPVSQVILAHKTSDGSLEYLSTITRDISELKQAQEEILRLNAGLEERVLQRTAQLQTVNQELEAFSYSVSHDLRTPLSAINGYSSLLSKNINGVADKERSTHYLTRIRAGVVQMGGLIDALLSLAQVSRSHIAWDTVDLSAIAVAVLNGYCEREPDRNVVLNIQPGVIVQGDVRLLRQVLENLLGNAWKFSSQAAPSCIGFGCSTGSAGEPIYTVQDNGAGFDMAYADKLFCAFQRLHTEAEFAGTGIGLATVHRIITRHNGRVWAESVPGQGASFHFTLGRPQD